MDGRARPLTARMLNNLHRLAALGAACVALCATAASAAARPDPQFANQWALQGDGPMGAASAWTQITGGDVTVAVVDTGVDLAHRDLAPNLWTNPGEVPGNGIDDDADGVVDDVHGADFVNGDGDPSDDNGHGTHVAGIVAARGDNGVGVAGLAWRARIMAVKVLGADASGDMATVAAGVRYAVAHGARVINLSLTGPSPGPDLAAAIDAAAAANVLVVAAAGNAHADDDVVASYPADFDAGNLVAVTSSDQRGVLAPSASFGRSTVDLSAPGEDILSTARGGGYELRSGSSMAAAQVSARPRLAGNALGPAGLGAADLAAGGRGAPGRRGRAAPRARGQARALARERRAPHRGPAAPCSAPAAPPAPSRRRRARRRTSVATDARACTSAATGVQCLT
jgi:subtilisin family serine protease